MAPGESAVAASYRSRETFPGYLQCALPPHETILDGMVLRCLVVDDNARFRAAARALLERQGVEVDVASTGAEAVRRTADYPLDVVLIDIDLGDESGFEVAHRIHESGDRHGSPEDALRIILISTHAEKDFEELIDESPALGFLSKSSLSVGAIQKLLQGRHA